MRWRTLSVFLIAVAMTAPATLCSVGQEVEIRRKIENATIRIMAVENDMEALKKDVESLADQGDVRGSTVGVYRHNVDASSSTRGPWSILSCDTNSDTLTLTNGFVEVHNDGGTTYLAPSDMTVTLANGPNYVYLEVNPVNSNCTLNVSYTAKPVSTTTLFRKVLWAITYSTSTTPHMITERFQYQNNNVEYTGWRPPW